MISKKDPDPAGSTLRYQGLVERFRDSQLSPREFVMACLQDGRVSAADATELLGVLKANVSTLSFTLADLTDDTHFRMGLYEVSRDDSENNPIFITQFDQSLMAYSEEVTELMEDFCRKLAQLVAERQEQEVVDADVSSSDVKEEAMSTIMDSLDIDAIRH